MQQGLTLTPLWDAMQDIVSQDTLRLHVPAHAGGNSQAWSHLPFLNACMKYDLTELPGLDVLGQPQEVLLQSQSWVAQRYGVAHSFYLINGASVGLMAAILSLKHKPNLLLARNCHRSVFHGAILADAECQWMLPEADSNWGIWGALSPKTLRQSLQEHPQTDAVVITHPTYEGIPSPIDELAQICREANVTFIVDEAHGSLWPFLGTQSARSIQSAVTTTADAVVHSLHKSAGSLTQTALIHLSQGSNIQPERLQATLNLLQTTSPSYVLLASMELCLAQWFQPSHQGLLREWVKLIDGLKAWINTSCKHIRACDQTGPFQLLVSHSKLAAETFAQKLESDHRLSFESYSLNSVLLLLHPVWALDLKAHQEDFLAQIRQALSYLDDLAVDEKDAEHLPLVKFSFNIPQQQMTPAQAFNSPHEKVLAEHSVDRIAAQVVATCPPGIPVLVPGELIRLAHLAFLSEPVTVVCSDKLS